MKKIKKIFAIVAIFVATAFMAVSTASGCPEGQQSYNILFSCYGDDVGVIVLCVPIGQIDIEVIADIESLCP